MPSLRQSSAMLTSPRRPSSNFSSAEWCRRVFLRMSQTVFSALSGMRLLACLIVAPRWGYDEPKILSYAISPFCPTSADGLQSGEYLGGNTISHRPLQSILAPRQPCAPAGDPFHDVAALGR